MHIHYLFQLKYHSKIYKEKFCYRIRSCRCDIVVRMYRHWGVAGGGATVSAQAPLMDKKCLKRVTGLKHYSLGPRIFSAVGHHHS
jgi:hypothetical protein